MEQYSEKLLYNDQIAALAVRLEILEPPQVAQVERTHGTSFIVLDALYETHFMLRARVRESDAVRDVVFAPGDYAQLRVFYKLHQDVNYAPSTAFFDALFRYLLTFSPAECDGHYAATIFSFLQEFVVETRLFVAAHQQILCTFLL